ncbi:uncharacterized protein LOC123530233 [Mercenaria mercenaria]|uniref:uncharacterized protein LOC123530233 n=1 Tax=Mercenaria mercenaria TaxID=6596 RepID=UPI00234F54A8|nr:uncharacterized protein LOC123530233 [Mercenaria mercenaria]
MFRNFYAEQNMTDPRDSWYKPNLLYNIHYRPPNPPTPPTLSTLPKMIVLTREFNPSVCTCGEHGCVTHYRMEREVVWSSKKARNEAYWELKEDIQAKRSAKAHRELKEHIQAERSAKAKTESIVDVGDDSGGDEIEDDDRKSKDDEEWKIRIDTRSRCSDRDGVSNSLHRFDAHSQQHKPDTDDVLQIPSTLVELEVADNEDFGSAFGILSVYCDSELHTWNWKNEFTG